MAVDILKPKSWVSYDPKNCRNCMSGCCTLPVRVDSEDLYHMGYLRIDQVNGPLKRITNKLIKEGVLQSYNAKTKLATLKRRRNSDCIFLDENRRCVIYERRPFVCRSFPEFSARPGFCPHQKKSSSSCGKVQESQDR